MGSSLAFPDGLSARLAQSGVIAVLVIDDASAAVPVARALSDGGVQAIELTLRTEAAWESLRRIRGEVPAMLVGLGTVLTPQQVDRAVEEGAAFAVAPGMNPATVAAAGRAGLPFAPGVCTPSDVELAIAAGCRLLKFFPSGPCGGLPYLRSIAAPFAHLGVRFIPLGGVNEQNAGEYLDDPLVHSIGGSWLAPRSVIAEKQWDVIRRNAQAAATLAGQRGGSVPSPPEAASAAEPSSEQSSGGVQR